VRFSVNNQRNTYDINGLQTTIIGYANYDAMKNMMVGESLLFTMDSRDDLTLIIEKLNIATNTWVPYVMTTATTTIIPYIYIDCEV
jgi:hypothetical protein